MSELTTFTSDFAEIVALLRRADPGYSPVLEPAPEAAPAHDEDFTHRVRYLTERIAKGARVLDLACGKGAMLWHLRQKNQAHVLGLERRDDWRSVSRGRDLPVFYSDFNHPDDANLRFALAQKWDTVLIIDTLGYWKYPAPILAALSDRVREIYVTVPNAYHFSLRLQALCEGMRYWPNCASGSTSENLIFDCNWNRNTWSLSAFQRWVEPLGYDCEILARRSKNEMYLPLPPWPSLMAHSFLFRLKARPGGWKPV